MRDSYEKQFDEHQKLLRQLQNEIAQLKAQLQALHQKQFKANAKSKTSPTRNSSPKTDKKRGAPRGHPGWYRKKPHSIDLVVEVPAPKQCPHCGTGNLKPVAQVWEHIQEDIVLQPRAQATLFNHAQAYCPCCDQEVVAPAEGEILNAPIGPVTKATASYLRFSLGLPYRKIQMLFETLFGLSFVPATAFGFDQMSALKGEALHEDLRRKIQNSSVIYADETHWRVDGLHHFLWYAGHDQIAYYQIDRHRSAEVARHILGQNFEGVLVSDDYAVYSTVDCKARQACLAHYIRHCKEILQKLDLCREQGLPDDHQARRFARKLRSLFQKACATAKEMPFQTSPQKIKKQVKYWSAKLKKICSMPLNFQDAETFRKRLLEKDEDWLTFLKFPNVDPTNNHAERSLRPSVIFRKMCFGNRSQIGASIHSILSSLIQTAIRQKVDPIHFLQTLILKDTPTAQHALFNDSS